MSTGTPLGNMLIKLSLDDSNFGKGVTGATKKITYFSKETQASMRIADLAGNRMGVLGSKFEGLSKIVGAQEQKVKALKKAYDDSFDENGKATDSTVRYATQLRQAEGQLANYRKQLANTAGDMAKWRIENEGLTGSINSFGKKLTSVGDRMQSLGSAFTKYYTLPMVAGIGLVTKAASDWESAFTGVKKTNDEIVDANGRVVYSYKDLEEGLRNLTKEMPATHTEIGNVAEAAGQLGIATQDVTAFTKTMIDLGESTNLSAEDAATSIAKLANITGLTSKEYEKFGSALVDLGNNFATTEADILAMATRLAGAGTQIGMTEAQILGFSTALSSVGIEAEAGGSAFSKVMINMQLAAETGGQGLEDFARVAGVSASDFKKSFQEDASGAIIAFVKGLATAEERGESAIKVLDDMGIKEVRLRDSLLRAAGASDVFSKALEVGSKAWSENTALSIEAGKRYETFDSQLAMLRNEVVDVAIDLGGPFVTALRSGVEAVKPVIQGVGALAKVFADADPKVQTAIIRVVAFTVAIGPTLKIVGKLSTGMGNLAVKTVDFMAEIAKKNAIAGFTQRLTESASGISKFSTVARTGATAATSLGTAAAGASGTTGIGAMTGALGALGPVALGVAGVIGVGGALYGAWKLFGEEAYNSAQRVERWGVDVGATTDSTLVTVRDNLTSTRGQFGLMAEGIAIDTAGMVENVELLGTTIEESLNKKVETLKQMLSELPENFDSATKDILSNELARNEEALLVVSENTQKISEIKQNAADNDRALSIAEARIISDLAAETTNAYVDTLDISRDEKQKILDAMNGDVDKASKEEARLWLVSLSEQRAAANEHINELRKLEQEKLKEMGYNLDGEFAQNYMKAWDESKKATIEGFDAQSAIIAQKYPELLDEVLLSNGQLASEMEKVGGYYQDAGKIVREANEDILKDTSYAIDELAENNEKAIENLKWTADAASECGETWNSIVLDPVTGEVKTNAREEILVATENVDVWNQLKPVIHAANLDSNVKKILGEAAVMNGYWDALAWEEKEVILHDEYSQNIYKALEDSGKWNDMTLEQKQAFINSNSEEVMAEMMLQLGEWETYKIHKKDIELSNYAFLDILSMSEEKLENWNSIPSETKELLGDNYSLLSTIYESDFQYKRWAELPDNEKRILANNHDFLEKVLATEEYANRWNAMPMEDKQLLANNIGVLEAITTSEEKYNQWMALPEEEKLLLADSTNLFDNITASKESLDKWNALTPGAKQIIADKTKFEESILESNKELVDFLGEDAVKVMLGDNNKFLETINGSEEAYHKWANLPDLDKQLTADNKELLDALLASEDTYAKWVALPDNEKHLLANNVDLLTKITESEEAYTTWINLPEEDKLILADNTPLFDAITESQEALDTWNGLTPEGKQILADSAKFDETLNEKKKNLADFMGEDFVKALYGDDASFMETLSNSEGAYQKWAALSDEGKKITADNSQFFETLLSSEEMYTRWSNLPDHEKQITADNPELLEKITESEATYNHWLNLPEEEKQLAIDNNDIFIKVQSSAELYNSWMTLPEEEKSILANNIDLTEKILASEEAYNNFMAMPAVTKYFFGDNQNFIDKNLSSEEAYERWMALPEEDKLILGDNADLLNAVFTSDEHYNYWKSLPDDEKRLSGDNVDLVTKVTDAGDKLALYSNTFVPGKNLYAYDYASENAKTAKTNVQEFGATGDQVVTLTTIIKRIGESALGYEKGTDFHRGGPMVVNDQRGSLYKELVAFPNGKAFIPEGRDVYIPDAPRGTKVYTASQTKRIVPHYADGVGVPKNANIIQSMDRINERNATNVNINTKDYSKQLEEIIRLFKSTKPIVINGGIRQVVENENDFKTLSHKLAWISKNEGVRMD